MAPSRDVSRLGAVFVFFVFFCEGVDVRSHVKAQQFLDSHDFYIVVACDFVCFKGITSCFEMGFHVTMTVLEDSHDILEGHFM